jgi:hypothetical protein
MADAALALLAKNTGLNSGSSISSSSSQSGLYSIIGSVILRALIIIIIVLVVLVFIHFTIRPIFKIKADDPGIIPTSNFSSEDKVFWLKKTDVSPLDTSQTPLKSSTSGNNFSLTLDIQIDDGHKYTNKPRIIFFKGADAAIVPPEQEDQVTAASLVKDGSLIFALSKDTNDLQVAIITENNNLEGVLLYNVPLRKPFRVGIVISDKRLEVYTNGLLSRTRSLSGPPRAITGGKFWPSQITGVQLRNLHIWPEAVTPGEMRAAIPALNTQNFDVSSLQESCSAMSDMSDMTSSTVKTASEIITKIA